MSSQADGQDEMDVSATPPDNVAKQSSESGVASKLPLVLSRSTKPGFLIQAEGETDLRGDVGTVGRFSLDSASAHDGAKLDLKGKVRSSVHYTLSAGMCIALLSHPTIHKEGLDENVWHMNKDIHTIHKPNSPHRLDDGPHLLISRRQT
eukprot:m.182923 g.182923  ORF g.182923 m.182923 type:complete len:149 (+) comp14681_c0_seq2:87-533(+)